MKTFEKNELFVHSFTALVAGPTGSGKTVFISKILETKDELIKPNIDKIIYCYSIWQAEFDILKNKNIEFYEGLYDISNLDSKIKNLIIFDDLMREASENDQILDMFTKGSHHKNTSVMLLTQNIFSKGKHARTISLN
jgi:septin family protein